MINIENEGSVEENFIQYKSSDYENETLAELNTVAEVGWIFSHWSGVWKEMRIRLPF